MFIAEPSLSGGRAPSDVWLEFRRPVDNAIVGRILEAQHEGVGIAVSAAREAFQTQRKTPLAARIGWLKAAAAAMRHSIEELAGLISQDVGKPIRMARFEVSRGIELIEACAAAVGQIGGETLPLDSVAAGAGLTGLTRRVPYGVVAGITPFNAPINLLLQKVAPAIAVGNSIVIKPALAGTRVALRLSELFISAGWPIGLFTVVTGDRETALALAAHPGVAAVTFTGGTAAGNDLARAAGARKFLAELGSNAANIVLSDADLKAAASKIASAGFEASGQQCISAQRVLVDRNVLGDFLPAFVSAAQSLVVGDIFDPKTDIGTMVHLAAAERVMSMAADAIERGAKAVLPPTREGTVITPGILVDVPRGARLWREEVFGPIVVVTAFDTIDEALELANDSEFGLQGAVFTNSLANAMRFMDDFEVGSLWINEASRFRLDMYPFGGVKQSGVGREGVRYAMEELSQLKFIGIRP
jgi:acyl-CoA reductase-like NAD-dependent aldehyde dehydrogenase